MNIDLMMDDDQLARFIGLLSDKCKEDTWQSLSEMVINAGLHALETMDEEKDNHMEKLVYVCGRCQHTSCHLTVETSDTYPDKEFRHAVDMQCPLLYLTYNVEFQLVSKPGEFTRGGE